MITSGNIKFYEFNTSITLGSFFKTVKAFLFMSYHFSEEFKALFLEVRHFITIPWYSRENLTDSTPANPGMFGANDLRGACLMRIPPQCILPNIAFLLLCYDWF